jgi:hypothetical protein
MRACAYLIAATQGSHRYRTHHADERHAELWYRTIIYRVWSMLRGVSGASRPRYSCPPTCTNQLICFFWLRVGSSGTVCIFWDCKHTF